MTAEEAVLLASELRRFVEERLPEKSESILGLSDLERAIQDLVSHGPVCPNAVIGNLETLEVKPVDLREWRRWGVDWLEDVRTRKTVKIEDRKEVDREGEA